MRRYLALKAQPDAEVRNEKFLGRDHVVVPVVALVEGVLQGMNAEAPEFAPASVFGKIPSGWDGRPVVMNHPAINGSPVPANSPTILETFSFGRIFNTKLEDGKLKTEAWIDVERARSLGGEFESTLQRLQNGETVEVSTGLFADVLPRQGKFNGKDYSGEWTSVVPDHLALLSAGTKGACSAEDGCGAPRNNAFTVLSSTTCICGGLSEDTCSCHEEPKVQKEDPTYDEDVTRLLNNAVADGIIDSDARQILRAGLREAIGGSVWVVGFTTNKVIYESFDEQTGNFTMSQRSYDISSDHKVSFKDDEERVNLFVQIVPAGDSALKSNRSEENTMPNDVKANSPADPTAGTPSGETPKTEVTTEEPKVETPNAPEVKTEAAAPAAPKAEEPKKPATMQEYLAAAPEELRESLESGMRLHQEKKTGIIKALMETGRCKFSEETLKTKTLEELENLRELAQVPSYEGRVANVKDHGSGNDEAQPAPIPLFPAKSEAA